MSSKQEIKDLQERVLDVDSSFDKIDNLRIGMLLDKYRVQGTKYKVSRDTIKNTRFLVKVNSQIIRWLRSGYLRILILISIESYTMHRIVVSYR